MPNPNEPELANKLVLTLIWENQKQFKMTAHDNSENKTIILAEEDGNLAVLWGDIESACKRYFQSVMEKVGTEMKKP